MLWLSGNSKQGCTHFSDSIMRPVRAGLLLLVLLAADGASAERCLASAVELHCETRCAGLNATMVASSNPPPEQVLAPPQAEALAKLENEAAAKRAGGGRPLIFAQLAEGMHGAGSPTAPTDPSDSSFKPQTVYAPAHRALSPEQLAALLGPAANVEWVATRRATFGCVDGRHAVPGVFAYGGDLGEFALALSVAEHVTQRAIGQAETTLLLEGWLRELASSGGGFGACVDASAGSQLAAAVGLSEVDLRRPPEESRAALMLRLTSADFVGSPHLKWQLQYPQTYATRRELVEQVVRSFYGILWNAYHPSHALLRLDTLGGEHAERAVVHVHASHWCSAEQGLSPVLAPKSRGGSVFIYHPEAVAARRDTLTRYLGGVLAPPVDKAEFSARLRSLGDGQSALTEKSLAGMLRSYSVMIK